MLRKNVGVLLAVIMMLLSVQTGFAGSMENMGRSSANFISKNVTVSPGAFTDDVFLKIQPSEAVMLDDEVIFTLTGGTFPEDLTKYEYSLGGRGYDDFKTVYEEIIAGGKTPERAFDETFSEVMSKERCVDLPYKLERVSDIEMKVILFEIPDAYAGEKFVDINRPAYKIPLPFTATGGDVKLDVDGRGTTITSNEYTIAREVINDNDNDDYEISGSELFPGKVNKYLEVKKGDSVNDLYLKIQPRSGVNMNDTIIFKIENGIFPENLSEYTYSLDGNRYDDYKNSYDEIINNGKTPESAFDEVFYDVMYMERCVEFPYKLERVSDREMKVILFEIPETYVGERFANGNKPAYRIPVPFTAEGGDVNLTVDGRKTSITSGKKVIAKDADSNEEYIMTGTSENTITKYAVVSDGDSVGDLYFKIKPLDDVYFDDTITFKLENGVFLDNMEDYEYSLDGKGYDYYKNDYDELVADGRRTERAFDEVFYDAMSINKRFDLPYKLERISDREMKVTLSGIPRFYAGKSFADVNVPLYKIPLPFKAEGNKNVKVNLITKNTSISNGTYNIAKNTASDEEYILEGGSYNSVNKVLIMDFKEFSDECYLRIEPKNQVNMDDTITLKIDGGKFDYLEKRYDYSLDGRGYNDYKEVYDAYISDGMSDIQAFSQTFYEVMNVEMCVDLPYEIEKVSDTEIKVKLFSLPEVFAGENFAGRNKPVYRIPVPFIQSSLEDVYINAITDNTSIKNGKYQISITSSSGNCGDGVDWKYSYKDDTKEEIMIVIEGNGAIKDYGETWYDRSPFWYDRYPFSIKDTIIISEGITAIGKQFFRTGDKAVKITIPTSVKKIADDSFDKWENVTILCDKNSYAEEYAKENGIKYELVKTNVSGVKLNKDKYDIEVGEEFKLEATVLPENAENKDVIWESDNQAVASVSDTGIVKGLSEGTAVIKATTKDGSFTASCIVTVKEEPISSCFGDVDGKNGVQANDAALVLKYVLTEDTTGFAKGGLDAADVSADGSITGEDAAIILKKVLVEGYVMPAEK